MKRLLIATFAALFFAPLIMAETFDLKHRTVELKEIASGFEKIVSLKNTERREEAIAVRQAEFTKNENHRLAKKIEPKITRSFEATATGFKISFKGTDQNSINKVKEILAKEKERLRSKQKNEN